MALFHSFLWLSNIQLYKVSIDGVTIHPWPRPQTSESSFVPLFLSVSYHVSASPVIFTFQMYPETNQFTSLDYHHHGQTHHHLLTWHLHLCLVRALCNSHSGTFKTEHFMSVTCSEPCNSCSSNTDGPKPHYMVCLFPIPPDSFPATLPSDSPASVILANFLSLKHSKEGAIARLMPFQNSTWNSPPVHIHRTLTSYKCLPKCHLFGENLPDHLVSRHTPSSFPHLILLIACLFNWPSIICLPTVYLPHWSVNF